MFTWISIPTPIIGNINLGDCMIILSACILDIPYALISGAVGAALCDVASGYGIYLPGTFIIKILMAVMVFFAREKILKSNKCYFIVVSGLCSEIIMILGYFIYEAFILGYKMGAMANVPFNALQGVVNSIVAALIFAVLKKSGVVKQIRIHSKE